jgi:hypothetical protein
MSTTRSVKGNFVIGFAGPPPNVGVGISATGTMTGKYVHGSRFANIQIGQGSTVIGNSVTDSLRGLVVSCPSKMTDNTAVNNAMSLVLIGDGCNNTNNVAP